MSNTHVSISSSAKCPPLCGCFRMGGEQNETYFCESKSLSMPTLRMTCEAKVTFVLSLLSSAVFSDVPKKVKHFAELQKLSCPH